MIGRAPELAAAEAAIADVRAGAVRTLALLGEAGIGKSALLDAIRAAAVQAGLLVLHGRAAEHERDVPYALVVDALDDHVAAMHPRRIESLGPELAAVLPAVPGSEPAAAAHAAERFRYHRALRSLLAMVGRVRPVALLLDDLHWADEASFELVLHLLRRPPAAPLLLVPALRPVEPARRLLDAVRTAPGAEHRVLGPLGRDASLALLAGLGDAGLRERAARDAGGNPLFLQELARVARGADDPLPATLVAAIELEVGALPPASRALIDGAAVAGDPFDPELAAAAAALDPADALMLLDRLVAVDLVRPGPHPRTFRFRHPLVRRAVYDAAPPGWRLAAHERAAAALAVSGAGAAVRAYHVEQFARTGDGASTALLTEAAQRAAEAAPATAAHWYGAALRLVPEDDVERRAALLGPMAGALADAGRLEEGRAAIRDVLELVPAERSAERYALIAACAQLELLLGRHADANRRLAGALDDAPAEARAELALQRAIAGAFASDAAATREWAARAARDAPGDAALQVAAGGVQAIGALWHADHSAARAALDGAAAAFAALDDAALAARLEAAVWLGFGEVLTERFQDADATLLRGLDVAERTGQVRVLALMTNVAAMNKTTLLELDESLRLCELAEERARARGLDAMLYWALWARVLTQSMRGERAEAERAAAEALAIVPRLEPDRATITGVCNLATVHADTDPERCIREMTAAAGPLLEQADQSWVSWLLLRLVGCAIALGRLDDAERWAAHATAVTARLQLPAGAVRAALAQAEVELARGDARSAAALATEAMRAAERLGSPADTLAARVLAGRALAASGAVDAGIALLQRAASDAGRAGAGSARDAAGRHLRQLGTRISARGRRAGLGSAALTEREHDVAELVARGRSNKQVAATLFLSEKTIEHHLSRIYAKLGVRSRVELATQVSR